MLWKSKICHGWKGGPKLCLPDRMGAGWPALQGPWPAGDLLPVSSGVDGSVKGSLYSPGQVWDSSGSVTLWVGQQEGEWRGKGERRKTDSDIDMLRNLPWLHANKVSMPLPWPGAKDENVITERGRQGSGRRKGNPSRKTSLLKQEWWKNDKSGEPSQKLVMVTKIADPTLWNLIVVLLSPVDQSADAATSLDKNENDDKQKNWEMWMQTAESTLVLWTWKINRDERDPIVILI